MKLKSFKDFGCCVLIGLVIDVACIASVSAQMKPNSTDLLDGYNDAAKPLTHEVIPGKNGEVTIVVKGVTKRGAGTKYCLTGVGPFWTGMPNQANVFNLETTPCGDVVGDTAKVPVSIPKEFWGRAVGLQPITIDAKTGSLYKDAKFDGWETKPTGPALQTFYSGMQGKEVPILAVYFEQDGRTRAATPVEAKTIKDKK